MALNWGGKKNLEVALYQTCRSWVADRSSVRVFHSSRWQCQQARILPEGYAMEWCFSDLTRTQHDTCMSWNTLPTHPSDVKLYRDIQSTSNQILNFLVSGTVLAWLSYYGGVTFTMSWPSDGQFEPFQGAQSEVTPQHWHDCSNRWNCSFPMGWSLFPGPLGARVCLPVGYGGDGHLSLTRMLPGKSHSLLQTQLATS